MKIPSLRSIATPYRIVLAAIFIAAAAIRLGPIAMTFSYDTGYSQRIVYVSDALGYKSFALQIERQGLSSLLQDLANHADPAAPTVFRTPLYPLFVSAISMVFGDGPTPVLLMQTLLDLGALALLYLIGRRIFSSRAPSLAAAALYAINPLAAMYASSVYAECFFSFLLILSVYVFVRIAQAEEGGRSALSAVLGVLAGLAALAKPVGVYIVVIYALALIGAVLPDRRRLKSAVASAGIVLGLFAATIAPWQLRNFLVYSHYALTFQQGREILVWRVGSCRASIEGIPKEDVWRDIQMPFLGISDYFERSQAEQAAAMDYIRAHPYDMLACHAAGVRNLFFPPRLFMTGSFGGSTPLATRYFDSFGVHAQSIASRIYSKLLFPFYLLALVGVWALWVDPRTRAAALVSVGIIVYVSQASSVDGYSRYAMPLQTMLALLVAAGGSWIIHRHRAYRQGIRGIL